MIIATKTIQYYFPPQPRPPEQIKVYGMIRQGDKTTNDFNFLALNRLVTIISVGNGTGELQYL